MHLVRRLAVKRLMRPGLIVERPVALQALVGRIDGVVRVHIDLLVFNALPQSLDEHVVSPTPFSVHADLDAVAGEPLGELLAGKLASLIGIEDFWRAIAAHGVLHRVQREISRERGGESPGQHPATGPVKNREERDEAPCHRNVGDIRRPDVIGTTDRQIAEEIRIDGVGRMSLTEARLAIQGLKTHAVHQRGHMSPANGAALLPQEIAPCVRIDVVRG